MPTIEDLQLAEWLGLANAAAALLALTTGTAALAVWWWV